MRQVFPGAPAGRDEQDDDTQYDVGSVLAGTKITIAAAAMRSLWATTISMTSENGTGMNFAPSAGHRTGEGGLVAARRTVDPRTLNLRSRS